MTKMRLSVPNTLDIKDDDRDSVIPRFPFTESGCTLKGRKGADG